MTSVTRRTRTYFHPTILLARVFPILLAVSAVVTGPLLPVRNASAQRTPQSGSSSAHQGQPAQPGSGQCPAGMVAIQGDYCPNVEQRCLRWIDITQMRCAEFAPTRCLSSRKRRISVCIDKYEYPNRRGVFPQVMVTWYQAKRACEARGARLCSMAEWTFACEGEQMLPYPWGLVRDNRICNFEHQRVRVNRMRLGNPATAADESARAYEAALSGQFDRCVSPFGVHDMVGNVDEWVRNETGEPFQSALKGGWWGPIRARCRPATLAHNETFIYYQIGFRCCANL
jgi:formylglycine-generating enzyme